MDNKYRQQRKEVKNLSVRKQELEREMDRLIQAQDIPGWTRKRQEFHEVIYKLRSAKQYLLPLKNMPIERTIPRMQ